MKCWTTDDGVYKCDFFDATGKRHRRSFDSKSEMRSYIKRIMSAGVADAEAPAPVVRESQPEVLVEAPRDERSELERALELYINHRRPEFRKHENFRAWKYVMNYFLDAMEDMGKPEGFDYAKMANINISAIYKLRTYWADRGMKASTINKRLQLIRPFFKWCKSMKLLTENPMEEVKRLPEEEPVTILWTEKLVKQFRPHIKPEFRAMFEFIHEIGCRPCEAVGLEPKDILWEQGFVTVGSYKGKDGKFKPRNLPISKELQDLLARTLRERNEKFPNSKTVFVNPRSGAKINPVRFAEEILRVRKILGVEEKLVPYGMRHTLMTTMAEMDVSTSKIMEVAGHSSLKTTQRYIHIRTESVVQAMGKVLEARRTGQIA